MTAAEKQILREQEAAEQRVVAEHDVLLTLTGGATVGEIAAIVNDLESRGDELDVHFLRDKQGVQGLAITGRISAEAQGRMR